MGDANQGPVSDEGTKIRADCGHSEPVVVWRKQAETVDQRNRKKSKDLLWNKRFCTKPVKKTTQTKLVLTSKKEVSVGDARRAL